MLIQRTFLALTLLVSTAHAHETTLNCLKTKWTSFADALVNTAALNFLASYGLSEDHFVQFVQNPNVINFVKESLDQRNSDLIADFQAASAQTTHNAQDIITVHTFAQKKFPNFAVTIIDDASLTINDVAIIIKYDNAELYLVFNCSELLKNPIDLHEQLLNTECHILHEDRISVELIGLLAFAVASHGKNLTETQAYALKEEIYQKLESISEAQAIRATIYRILNSPTHAEEFLSNPNFEGPLFETLKIIQNELKSCAVDIT